MAWDERVGCCLETLRGSGTGRVLGKMEGFVTYELRPPAEPAEEPELPEEPPVDPPPLPPPPPPPRRFSKSA